MKIGILTGPTAAGKTQCAFDLCALVGSDRFEIINADSILIYRGLDIGSAKPDLSERNGIPHHLIDIRDPDEVYTAGDFSRDVHRLIEEIQNRGKLPLIVGGTGFYLKILLYGLWNEAGKGDPILREELEKKSNRELFDAVMEKDQEFALKVSLNNRYRLIRALEVIQQTGKTPTQLEKEMEKNPDPRFRVWIIDRNREELIHRIQERTQKMLATGLIEETQALFQAFPDAKSLHSIGYQQVLNYLDQRVPEGRKIKAGREGLFDEINLATRQLVKKQRTWFKSQVKARTFLLDTEWEDLKKEFLETYPYE